MRGSVLLVLVLLLAGCGDGGRVRETARAPAEPGEDTYRRFCGSCHGSGAAGAPRVGDAEAWAPRVAQGLETLVDRTEAGVRPGMPARGLCRQCDRAELRAAVRYMVERSGGFPEAGSRAVGAPAADRLEDVPGR